MSKLLRRTLTILAALIALIGLLVVALMFVINPNQYRSTIEDAMYDATGLQLNIAGDLSLSYRPYIGVELNDVRVRNPDRPQELASSSLISLRIDPMELLKGNLLVEELRADDFHFNWYVDAQGDNYWMTEQLTQSAASDAENSNEEASTLAANFNFVSIANASVDIQNLQQGYIYTIRDLDLNSQDSNIEGRPFALQATFELVNHTTPNPWPLTLSSNNSIDLDAGDISISDIQLASTPALIEGGFQVSNLFGDLNWQATFNTNTFALDDLLANLYGDPDDAAQPRLPGIRPEPIQQMQWQASLEGNSNQVQLTELITTLGDMRLEMNAEVRFANEIVPTNMSFEIETNDLDLSPYLTTGDEPERTSEPASVDPFSIEPVPTTLYDIAFPDSLLSDMNVQGTVAIDSLFMAGLQIGGINLYTILESGVLDIETQPIEVLDGIIEGNVRINSMAAQTEVTLQLDTNNLNIADLSLPMLVPGTLGGRINLESSFSGRGPTLGEWLDSFSGTSSFTVTDNSVDIGIIKQVFTAIASLSPSGEAIQQWPDVLRFNDFSGLINFEDGLDNNQQITLMLDNFVISGTGGVDFAAEKFNYDLWFNVLSEPFLQTIPINDRYHGVAWPVQCIASFTDPVNQYCRPDLAQVREIFSQLGTNALQNRVDEEIDEQVPEAPLDTPRSLFRNPFQN